ncbi:hypothetical protein OPV22_031829 [Ensete ventricosum]|uniref:Uncharacterized protein n=1 Tax=Ensete ventricosum TaxID=4639 RepID=A0AAV8PQ09_ENSVE|nr:hypothetical protein OPV22_031829 [Ensete ventricosum]
MSRKRSRSEAGRCAAEGGTKAGGAWVGSVEGGVGEDSAGSSDGLHVWEDPGECGRRRLRSHEGVGDRGDSDAGKSGCATLHFSLFPVYADQLKYGKAPSCGVIV